MELKDIRAQLADSVKENKRLRRGIYGKCLDKLYYSSARKYIERVVLVGMLTGCPKEEMPASAGDAGHCSGLVAIKLPAKWHGGACGYASRNTAVLPIVEDVSLPTRCKRSLDYGEDTLQQA